MYSKILVPLDGSTMAGVRTVLRRETVGAGKRDGKGRAPLR